MSPADIPFRPHGCGYARLYPFWVGYGFGLRPGGRGRKIKAWFPAPPARAWLVRIPRARTPGDRVRPIVEK